MVVEYVVVSDAAPYRVEDDNERSIFSRSG
jgi:hypothetical protein